MSETTTDVAQFQAILNLREMMEGQNILLVYRGAISDEISNNILSMSKENLGQEEDENSRINTFGAMVECIQTICSKDAEPKSDDSSIFILGQRGNELTLCTGSMVPSGHMNEITEALQTSNSDNNPGSNDILNKLSDLDNTSHQGLINVAGQMGGKIEFEFNEVDAGHSYLTLNTIFKI